MLPAIIKLFPALYYLHLSITTCPYCRTDNILVLAASMAFLLV